MKARKNEKCGFPQLCGIFTREEGVWKQAPKKKLSYQGGDKDNMLCIGNWYSKRIFYLAPRDLYYTVYLPWARITHRNKAVFPGRVALGRSFFNCIYFSLVRGVKCTAVVNQPASSWEEIENDDTPKLKPHHQGNTRNLLQLLYLLLPKSPSIPAPPKSSARHGNSARARTCVCSRVPARCSDGITIKILIHDYVVPPL